MALRPTTKEMLDEKLWLEKAAARYNKLGGYKWVRGFLKRNPGLTLTISKHRPIEKERAAKTQPEISIQHFRNLAHAIALCQIQRAVASGRNVPGWVLSQSDGIVT